MNKAGQQRMYPTKCDNYRAAEVVFKLADDDVKNHCVSILLPAALSMYRNDNETRGIESLARNIIRLKVNETKYGLTLAAQEYRDGEGVDFAVYEVILESGERITLRR